MNRTYTLECACELRFSVHLKEGQEIGYCRKCKHYQGITVQYQYAIRCFQCHETSPITGDVAFPEGKGSCPNCHIVDTISFTEEHTSKLHLVSVPEFIEDCEKCQQKKWTINTEEQHTCPFCRRIMHMYLSSEW